MGTILVSICGCETIEPPDISNVEEGFMACYDDTMLIVEYLISMEYDVAEIDNTYILGEMSIMDGDGYKNIKIDASIKDAVKRLMKEYKYISKSENTIIFCQWNRFNDASCGIAYSINGVDKPEIQYLVELTPLEKMDWYYYVQDYNLWRVDGGIAHSTGDGSLC